MEYANKLDEAVANAPYSTDWFKMRNNMLNLVSHFIESNDCEWVHVYEKEIGDTKFHFIAFYIYDSLYIWADTIVNGLIESSQLDKPLNDFAATVLYCNVDNAMPIAPLLFRMIDNKEVTQLM